MFRRPDRRLVRIKLVFVFVLAAGVLAAPAQGQATPSARQIVDRSLQAIGGRDAFKTVSSFRATGTFELPGQNIRGSLEMLQARPAKFRLKATVQGIGTIETGYNGTHGWSINPLAGPSLLTGRKLREIADDAWFDGPLYEPTFVKSVTMVERLDFDARPAYKLQVIYISGTEEFHYFDVETGLMLGTEARRETDLGIVPTIGFLREYKTFGPLLQPTVIVQRPLGIEQIVRLTVFEYNAVPPESFDPPAEVKALIK